MPLLISGTGAMFHNDNKRLSILIAITEDHGNITLSQRIRGKIFAFYFIALFPNINACM